MATRSNNFYDSNEWQTIRHKVRATWKRQGLGCGICGQPLDWVTRAANHVDHIVSHRQAPSLALDMSNLRVVHASCNSVKRQYEDAGKAAKETIGIDGLPDSWR